MVHYIIKLESSFKVKLFKLQIKCNLTWVSHADDDDDCLSGSTEIMCLQT